jgi:hypothetical protein
MQTQRPLTIGLAALAILAACDGSTKPTIDNRGTELRLASVDYGRLVDIYAYRRVDLNTGQRRDVGNRTPALIARDVVIDPRIEAQSLFDPLGEEDPNADFQFQPFSTATGHEELLILWDDRHPDEQVRFQAALTRAQTGLVPVAAAYTGQNTAVQPMPVVPRNAALRLRFTQAVSVDQSFFVANPAALQVLEIVDDPLTVQPQRALRALPYRVTVAGDTLVLDPSLIGGEVQAGGKTTSGLPVSRDSVGANIRIAIPTQSPSSNLGVKEDRVAQLNGRDRTGLPAVIRDFRTGNASDGRVGNLVDTERPMLVADVPMGITAIDPVAKVLTLNKRGAKVAVRGLVPFVVGPLAATPPILPLGPAEVPTVTPLRTGDVITQLVATPNGPVRLRAVVVMNQDVGNAGTLGTNPDLGRAADGSDGGDADTVRVQVASLTFTDAAGNTASFQASSSPSGADCTVRVHSYEHVPYRGSPHAVSDATRRAEFVGFDPVTPRIDPVTRQPIPLGTRIAPGASLALRFSEPLDFSTIDPTGNICLGNRDFTAAAAVAMLSEPKAAALSMLASAVQDFQLDGTVVRINLPLGHTHEQAQSEQYWLHVLSTDAAAKDLGGNPLDIFERRENADARRAFSVDYTLDPAAPVNLVGMRVVRFEATDEDGTRPGSPDWFGQFELRDGRLWGAAVQRFNKAADAVGIRGIQRGNNGECFTPGSATANPPIPGAHVAWGPLYTTPSMVQQTTGAPPNPFQPPTTPYIYGGIAGPHNPRGMREQVTFREDDFQLGYHDTSTQLIDVEQLYWSPFLNRSVLFDQFDRYTICGLDCASLFSGLSNTFDDNPLNGVMVEVVKDAAYTIEPAKSFTGDSSNVYAPYPRFARTFTWRDSRLVGWDVRNQVATGLGGANDPSAQTIPPQDTTTDVSSPWERDVFPISNFPTPPAELAPESGLMVTDPGDFIGDRQRDHDPIALPLLVEFNVWPDDRTINGRVSGANRMHIGYVGINEHQSPSWGYFNIGTVAPPLVWGRVHGNTPRANCTGLPWPSFTVHTGGGVNSIGVETLVDPSLARVAQGSLILDAGATDLTYGLRQVPAANDHLPWTQADFVRRVSMVTFGFFDTLQPNRHALRAGDLDIDWPGLGNLAGVPDFAADGQRRAVDVVTLFDPPLEQQPTGTAVRFELRGIESIARADALWDRAAENRALTRNNLANPEYACEAFRYAMANPGPNASTPRVVAEGVTPYVDLENVEQLRNPNSGLLPRFLNFRLVMENDVNVAAPKRPSLRSMAVVYRLRE